MSSLRPVSAEEPAPRQYELRPSALSKTPVVIICLFQMPGLAVHLSTEFYPRP